MKPSKVSISYILSFAIAILSWKLLALTIASPILPAPELALYAFLDSCTTSLFWKHFGISTYRVFFSMVVAWCLAFPLGMLLGYSRRFDRVFSPIIFMTYPIPKIVLLPVILLLFGMGNFSKIILIGLILFFQILVTTRDGVKGIDEKYYDSLRSLGASNVDILREVVFPAALPHSFTALRITTGTAISVLFFVESFATASGLGYLIMDAWVRTEYTHIYVGIIGMSILGLSLYELFRYLERKVCPWQGFSDDAPEEDVMLPFRILLKINVYLRMIKFSHTIFALPFALATLILARRYAPVTLHTIFWIIMAMIGARSAAMGFNRYADALIDKKNPRTSEREIPSGTISLQEVMAFLVVSSLVFIVSSAVLSTLSFWLSFPILFILFFYSYTKRFTWVSHIVLGFSISLVPPAVWIAVTDTISIKIFTLSIVLLTYIAGFDILYACQDLDFDRKEKLYSIPAIFGIKRALNVSSLLHVISFLSFASLYWIFDLNPVFLLFAVATAILFTIEHKLVKPDDLSRVHVAFYHINSIISVLLFIAVLCGDVLRSTV